MHNVEKARIFDGTSNGKYPPGKDIFHDAVNELCLIKKQAKLKK